MAHATTAMLLRGLESSRQYGVQDFLRTTRTQPAATVDACDLYYIPSRSSWYHKFLLVHIHDGQERLMFTVPSNNGMQVISSNGGVTKDTITVVRAREHHEYWQRAGWHPVLRGTLRWDCSPPRLFDIAFFASATCTTFKHYNLYVRQCYWYARITLVAMMRVFPSCSREGTTSFSGGWLSMFRSYKPSQVQLLIDLHTNYCRDLHPPAGHLPPMIPTMEVGQHASASITPDILHGVAMFIANFQRPLSHSALPKLAVVIVN
ncbi:hypothetical protein F5J12DRAFT_849688 [Pisolithus orientalis]|uniref:uncharacterized protein n=1 Tax=Pisolithus orientalis TaxID=936130 RepID=UPI0022247F00|nr:uncharacterized protein F5J12DRAFT_849688 [Pisolithus orientalis]KAI5998328.1 hypothetical protein F5J12DRAFT_849688 [Pisolithus orientalis]